MFKYPISTSHKHEGDRLRTYVVFKTPNMRKKNGVRILLCEIMEHLHEVVPRSQ